MEAISTPNCLCCGEASLDYLEHLLEKHNFNLARAREVIGKGKRDEEALSVVNENSNATKTTMDSNVLKVGGVPITLPKDGSTNGHVYNIHLNFGGTVAEGANLSSRGGDEQNMSNVDLTSSLPVNSTAFNQTSCLNGNLLNPSSVCNSTASTSIASDLNRQTFTERNTTGLPENSTALNQATSFNCNVLPTSAVHNSITLTPVASDPNLQATSESNSNGDDDIVFLDEVVIKKDAIMQLPPNLAKVKKEGGHSRKRCSDEDKVPTARTRKVVTNGHNHHKLHCKTCDGEDNQKKGNKNRKKSKRKLRVKAGPKRGSMIRSHSSTKEPDFALPNDDGKLNSVELMLKHGKIDMLVEEGGVALHKCKICSEECTNTKVAINNHVTSRHDISAIQYQALYFEEASLWHKVGSKFHR